MRLSIIVAMAKNRVIGRGGALPWRLSTDLKRFKALTMGHHLIMGRKTFESIGRVLPGRKSIVISRGPEALARSASEGKSPDSANNPVFAESLDRALRIATADTEAFVIGGASIYELAIPLADRLYVTHVKAEIEGDTYFPAYDESLWRLVEESHYPVDEKNEFPHRFCIYDRIKSIPN